eukprot:scaffold40036_cov39-Phaeocystis_antarctica.AAC.3
MSIFLRSPSATWLRTGVRVRVSRTGAPLPTWLGARVSARARVRARVRARIITCAQRRRALESQPTAAHPTAVATVDGATFVHGTASAAQRRASQGRAVLCRRAHIPAAPVDCRGRIEASRRRHRTPAATGGAARAGGEGGGARAIRGGREDQLRAEARGALGEGGQLMLDLARVHAWAGRVAVATALPARSRRRPAAAQRAGRRRRGAGATALVAAGAVARGRARPLTARRRRDCLVLARRTDAHEYFLASDAADGGAEPSPPPPPLPPAAVAVYPKPSPLGSPPGPARRAAGSAVLSSTREMRT